MSPVRAHAVPFYCPYCGDEDLVPEPPPGEGAGEGHGHWSCRACRRAFRLSLTALATARTATAPTATAPTATAPTGSAGSSTTPKDA